MDDVGVSAGPTRTLVVIIGPPAVGKMTVGRALQRLTGLPLFHNHMTIELVLPFFPFGSPPFTRLVGEFRRRLFEEVARSDLPGLIFTYVWALEAPGDLEYVKGLKELFERQGGRVVFAELSADLETRLRRNATPERLREKPSKRDVAASRTRVIANEERHRMNSDGDFPFPDHHLFIDNSNLEPERVAHEIARTFALPTLDDSVSHVGES